MTLPRIDHIGIIVPDLDAAVVQLSALLAGQKPERRDLPDVQLQIAMFHTQNLKIELIAYNGPAQFARQVMGQQFGLNHISIAVDNVEDALTRLVPAGFAVQPGFPRGGAHGRVAFFERDAATGLLFEICAPSQDEKG